MHYCSIILSPILTSHGQLLQVTRLLEKRKQMLEVQKALDAQKDEYLRKEELFKRREENLRKKDLELQEALVLFNKFLKENEHKRRRADHRAYEEHKKTQRWQKEIQIKKQNLEDLREKCRHKKLQHAKNVKYQQFLQDVLEKHGNHFDEIQSIITRHTTLEDAYSDLIDKQRESTTKNEELRNKFQQFKKDQYNHTLSLNNNIAHYSKKLEEAVKSSGDIEEQIIADEKTESLRKRETTQIIMAVDNLYNRCRKVVNSVIKHGVKRLSVKEKEGMDPMLVRIPLPPCLRTCCASDIPLS